MIIALNLFEAKHKKTGAILAVKKVLADGDFSEIIKEINIMKALKNDHIISYYANFFLEAELWVKSDSGVNIH
jgi:hypothetical protein